MCVGDECQKNKPKYWIMFYYPQRDQAIKIQETLKTLYRDVEGEYYAGDEAWLYLKAYSGVDLKAILTQIADERIPELKITNTTKKMKKS